MSTRTWTEDVDNPDTYRRIRVLVVGPSGAGKTTICSLLANMGTMPSDVSLSPHAAESSLASTIGCNAFVRVLRIDQEGRRLADATPIEPSTACFIDLIDVGGHPRYADLRHVFYSHAHGVMLIYDCSNRRAASVVRRWASEVATMATFHALLPPDLAAANLEGIPVPVLLIGNKMDRKKSSSLLRGQTAWMHLLTWLVGHGLAQRGAALGLALRSKLFSSASSSSTPLPLYHHQQQHQATTEGMPRTSRAATPSADFLSTTSSSNDETVVTMPTASVTRLECSASQRQIDVSVMDDFFALLVARRYHNTTRSDVIPSSGSSPGTPSLVAGVYGRTPSGSIMMNATTTASNVMPTTRAPLFGSGGGGGGGGGVVAPKPRPPAAFSTGRLDDDD